MKNEIRPNLYLSDMYDAARLKDKRVKQIMMAPIPTEAEKRLDDPILENLHPDFNYPMTDDPDYAGNPKNMKLLKQGAKKISELLSERKPVLVYCHAGMSRSPATVIKYLMDTEHLTYDDALKEVEDKRPSISINPAIELALRRMER
jgi:protein-tyrosine phosphatase